MPAVGIVAIVIIGAGILLYNGLISKKMRLKMHREGLMLNLNKGMT